MISQRTKYAIKALVYLAQQGKGQLIKTSAISKNANIPKKFLEQILLDLKRASMVTSRQGAAGGYYLNKDAKKINLADIYRLFDGAVALLPCASEKFYVPCQDCLNEKTCSIKWGLLKVREKTLKALEEITILNLANH